MMDMPPRLVSFGRLGSSAVVGGRALINGQTSSNGLLRVLRCDLRHCLFKCGRIEAAGGDALERNLVAASNQRISVCAGHMLLDLVRDGFDHGGEFFAHALELLQFIDLGDDIGVRHLITTFLNLREALGSSPTPMVRCDRLVSISYSTVGFSLDLIIVYTIL